MGRKIFFSVLFILGGVIAAKAMGQAPEVATTTSPVAVSEVGVKEINQITSTGGYSFPVWSPDGTKIYVAGKYPDTGIVRMNPDGTGEEILTTQHYAGDGFKLSSDGSMIVYTASEMKKPVHFTLWVMNADGSNKKQLTTTNAAFPNWSPDSKKIIYVAGEEESIYIIEPDGSKKTKLLTGYPSRPIYSPNGQEIVFTAYDEVTATGDNLWMMDANGGNRRSLGTECYGIQWSTDSKKIFYNPGGGEIWIANINTGEKIKLTENSGYFSLSGDGMKIVYDSLRLADPEIGIMEDSSDIWIIGVDGSNKVQLTSTTDLIEVNPQWSPDGKKIVFSDYKEGRLYLITLE